MHVAIPYSPEGQMHARSVGSNSQGPPLGFSRELLRFGIRIPAQLENQEYDCSYILMVSRLAHFGFALFTDESSTDSCLHLFEKLEIIFWRPGDCVLEIG
jgi:hypothetical protein